MKTNYIIAIICLVFAIAVSFFMAPYLKSFILDEAPTNATQDVNEMNSDVMLEKTTIKDNVPTYNGEQKTVVELEKDFFYQHTFTSVNYSQFLFDELNKNAIELGWNKNQQLQEDQEVANIYQMQVSGHYEQLQIKARTYRDETPTILGISKYIFDQDVVVYPKGYIISFLTFEDDKVKLMASYTTYEPRNSVLEWYKSELKKNGWSISETEKDITANKSIENIPYTFFISYPNPSPAGKFSWSIGLVRDEE